MAVPRQTSLIEYLVDMSFLEEKKREEEEIEVFEYAVGYRNDNVVERMKAKVISWLQVAGMKLGLEDVTDKLIDSLYWTGSISREDLGWLNKKLENAGLGYLKLDGDLWNYLFKLGLIY